jgi:predicted AlkP superfamily phosphohydrolase/phosphomutase
MDMLIVGLDGATFDIIRPLIHKGRLPHLQRLIETGTSASLRSTLPPVTAPAWSSFMTGTNPGKHGIFQWRTYDPTKYTCVDESVVTAARLAGNTFWDILSSYGHRVGIITVPVTYPPWPVNGFMLSGYPCPDAHKNYTFPQAYADSLTERYNFSADYYLAASEEEVWRNGLEMLRKRTSLAIELIRKENLDACVLVLGEIDRAQHDFWKYYDSSFPAYHSKNGHAFREVIAEHYEVSDAQVGRLLELADEQTTVVVMSDHGAGPHPSRYFHTNSWLKSLRLLEQRSSRIERTAGGMRRGLEIIRSILPFEERVRRMLPAGVVHGARQISLNISSVDWSRTKAFRFPMYHPAEGIEINLRGRQPQGIVEPGAEYEETRDLIVDQLRRARDPETGVAIVEEIHKQEEIYSGPYLQIAPDIVFVTSPQFKAEREIGPEYVCPVPLDQLEKYNGLHQMDGIFIAQGRRIKAASAVEGAGIMDVAPTVLYAMGLPVPEHMDGRVLVDAFVPSYLHAHPPQYTSGSAPIQGLDSGLSPEDERAMRDKLRGLGYLS